MKKKLDECINCGRAEDDHCTFEAICVPVGCMCEPREWENPKNIPPICKAFKRDPYFDAVCESCEHDEECHKPCSAK